MPLLYHHLIHQCSMGKENNLGDFLADLANAIREKTGESSPINPQDFSQKIKDISAGGDVRNAPMSDVNFVDHEGNVLYSYSKNDFLALNEMPSLPLKNGLVGQGWNWSLEDVKAELAESSGIVVGANYVTDDGKTRLYIRIPNASLKKVTIGFGQTIANGVEIDFGDGSAPTTYGSAGDAVSLYHTYQNIGDYCITLKPKDGCTMSLGQSSSSYGALGAILNDTRAERNILKKVEIGSNVTTITRYAFNDCYSLKSISMPKEVTSINDYAFSGCRTLSSMIVSNGVTKIPTEAFKNCYAANFISLPNGVKDTNSNCLYNCGCLVSLYIPTSVNYIAQYSMYNCEVLTKISIPKLVTTIYNYTFYNCYGLDLIDFSQHTSVPSLSSTNALTNVPSSCKILVPDALYDSWIAATNWSSHANKIVKASEFNG